VPRLNGNTERHSAVANCPSLSTPPSIIYVHTSSTGTLQLSRSIDNWNLPTLYPLLCTIRTSAMSASLSGEINYKMLEGKIGIVTGASRGTLKPILHTPKPYELTLFRNRSSDCPQPCQQRLRTCPELHLGIVCAKNSRPRQPTSATIQHPSCGRPGRYGI